MFPPIDENSSAVVSYRVYALYYLCSNCARLCGEYLSILCHCTFETYVQSLDQYLSARPLFTVTWSREIFSAPHEKCGFTPAGIGLKISSARLPGELKCLLIKAYTRELVNSFCLNYTTVLAFYNRFTTTNKVTHQVTKSNSSKVTNPSASRVRCKIS